MSRGQKIGEIMVSRGYLPQARLMAALEAQTHTPGHLIGVLLVQQGAVTAEQVAEALAEQLGLPYVDPLRRRVDPALVWKVSRTLAEEREVLPLERSVSGAIEVAMANPRDINTLRDLEFVFHSNVTPMVASGPRIGQAIQRHYSLEHRAQQMLSGVDADWKAVTTSPTGLELDGEAIASRLRAGGSRPYVDLLNFLLINAIERKASDIHLDPQADDVRIRFRIDGMLREALTLPPWSSRPLVSRIKVVGLLDLSVHNRPQDGKVTASLGVRKIDLRISIVPSQYGEKVVIRLLDHSILQADLGNLGWSPRALSSFYRMVSQPQGLVLCVGPTGSGKSTTLYATIHRLRSETTSIVTVEDPIEYSLPGITQIQVNEKLGMQFSSAVRSILRQDPNVIIIGEIRDAETADAAFEAANTGHLVLSTLHTNHAIGTITRLLDLKVPPWLLGTALTGIVAQRLVRKVCHNCGIQAAPEQEDWTRLGVEPIDLGPGVRRAGPGCPQCRYVGYTGRLGVIEVLNVTDGLRQMLLEGAGEDDLWRQARTDGLVTLFDEAMEKVRAGLTTLEEIARVVPVDPWRSEAARAPRQVPVMEDTDEPLIELGGEHLEVLEEAVMSPVEGVPPLRVQRARPRIVIADDAEEVLQLVGITLEDDYDLDLTRDGAEALSKVEEVLPDLVILDVMMPRMSGFEVCERLRENLTTAAIPVLFLSARGERTHVKQGFHVGADDYLAKPFDPEELQLRVRALLRRARSR